MATPKKLTKEEYKEFVLNYSTKYSPFVVNARTEEGRKMQKEAYAAAEEEDRIVRESLITLLPKD